MDIAEITDNLTFLDDWEDRYRYVIELGQQLEPIEDAERNPANKVEGCVSQVWLVTDRREEDGKPVLSYRGDSDAMIVKGLVAILIALYSGRSPSEIAETDALDTFDELGLREHLTTQRSNGLVAMVKRIRSDAARLSRQS
ncbi:SufE family protein [Cucumibacter marinus]|uniref:SufE family protein n=1 Tax=Cucumibacter marinus TaxID=1121252 RepID=UPI00040F8568|nr:SufE family protein [Cucumibacter marinus]